MCLVCTGAEKVGARAMGNVNPAVPKAPLAGCVQGQRPQKRKQSKPYLEAGKMQRVGIYSSTPANAKGRDRRE